MISIIIPTRNRASLLGSAVLSLASQCKEFEDSELIIVDNGSKDSTHLVCKSLGSHFRNYTYLHEASPGLHAGRHRGCSVARGSILVFLDDDVEVTDTWLSAIIENFSSDDLAMLGGNSVPIFYGTYPRWLDSLWNSRGDDVHSLPWLSIQEQANGKYPISPYMVWGCNFAIRRDVLIAAGGFHPDGMPQDLIRFRGDGETHVSKYIADNKLKCMFDSRASVYHKVTPERMTLGYFRKRGFNQGVSDSYTCLRNAPKVHSITPPSSHQKLMPRLRNKLRAAKKKALGWSTPSASTLNPAQAAFHEGYKEGFAYHQSAYESDPEVRAWVHKETYF
ncbi:MULTISPECIES: glycosyltransferase family 2 protein [unclassified Cyanobium]|uniref:glycosyltransferase family 2 protein n=1 Tax=unclassified Cyanobium TaxID=2627006 RepID=UPI0020CDC60B|nr:MULTISPECIES: glycosyltransferase family 2 protein [unclassified Cyanobium]MCP9776971.1 glycosyltransferase family 2 protein [Cyanobium sp. Tous-M-B4]MCP9875237.1 glycosyltransferase family 2 protein [Cyanobium sp. A2C-AMD]